VSHSEKSDIIVKPVAVTGAAAPASRYAPSASPITVGMRNAW